MRKKFLKPEKIQTFLAGALLILNGNLVLDDFPDIGIFLILAGGLLLLYFFAVSLKIPQDPIIKIVVVALEGIGFLTTSFIFFELGKVYLPYGYLLAALTCFFGVLILIRRMKRMARQQKDQVN